MKPRSQVAILLWATILIAPSSLPAQTAPQETPFNLANLVTQQARSLRGTLTDTDGRPLANVRITLTVPPTEAPQTATAIDGTCPPVATQADVVTQKQLAAKQIESEKSQRLLGVFPNFFVVYDSTTPPLTAKQKFRLSGTTLIDPGLFVTTGISAGIEQATGHYSGFGSGVTGYWSRFGADYATSFTGIMITGAALPSLFHQDPRYFYKGKGSIRSRLWYVTSRSVVQKGDDGKWQPAYSNVLGNLAAGTISTVYYPSEDRNWRTVPFENLGISIGGAIINNFLQEFVFSHLTTKKKPKP